MPWPHRYLAQDVTQAFIKMGLFFPTLKTTRIVRDFLESKDGCQFKNSKLFDLAAWAKDIPDRRSRDSGAERPKSFYGKVEEIYEEGSWVDNYPLEWNKTVRPIIAKRLCLSLSLSPLRMILTDRAKWSTGPASSSPRKRHLGCPKLAEAGCLRRKSPIDRANSTCL